MIRGCERNASVGFTPIHLSLNGYTFMLDCGGEAERADAIIITHAHLDHCQALPAMVRKGFRGKVFCTPATKEAMKLMLLDAVKVSALTYTEEEVYKALSLVETKEYGNVFEVGEGVYARFLDAGHVIGSAMVVLDIDGVVVCYTGDIGNFESPLHNPPEKVGYCDILIMESTYGDRNRLSLKEGERKLIKIIEQTKGKVIIPVFALGRAQEVLLVLRKHLAGKGIPVYFDTPLGKKILELYFRYYPKDLFLFDELHFVESHEESLEIAKSKEKCVVLATSGMLEGGRIQNYSLSNPEDTLVFVGYQAEGTRGRMILDGEEKVGCKVYYIDAFSAHADQSELLRFLDENFDYIPDRVYLVHGETTAKLALKTKLKKWKVFAVPEEGTSFPIYSGTLKILSEIPFERINGKLVSKDKGYLIYDGIYVRFVRERSKGKVNVEELRKIAKDKRLVQKIVVKLRQGNIDEAVREAKGDLKFYLHKIAKKVSCEDLIRAFEEIFPGISKRVL